MSPAIPQVSVDEFAAALADGATVLDVRMHDEYEESHVPGAVLIPLPELPDRLSDVPDADPLYVICRSGARSMSACEFLADRGRTATNVSGGTLAWIDSGRAVAIGAEPG